MSFKKGDRVKWHGKPVVIASDDVFVQPDGALLQVVNFDRYHYLAHLHYLSPDIREVRVGDRVRRRLWRSNLGAVVLAIVESNGTWLILGGGTPCLYAYDDPADWIIEGRP